MQNTYWNHKGRFETFAAAVQELVPVEGAVHNVSKNRALERFRKAVNCYYDLYNNGLCNRAASFNKLFGLASSHYRLRGRIVRFDPSLYEDVEAKMDQIVLDAYAEQFPEEVLRMVAELSPQEV